MIASRHSYSFVRSWLFGRQYEDFRQLLRGFRWSNLLNWSWFETPAVISWAGISLWLMLTFPSWTSKGEICASLLDFNLLKPSPVHCGFRQVVSNIAVCFSGSHVRGWYVQPWKPKPNDPAWLETPVKDEPFSLPHSRDLYSLTAIPSHHSYHTRSPCEVKWDLVIHEMYSWVVP